MAFPSKEAVLLRDGFLAEYVSGLGRSYAMHQRGGKKKAGEFVERVSRILNDQHIVWEFDRDPSTMRIRKEEGRAVIRKGHWIQPFHEAVKRLGPPVTDESRLSEGVRKERHRQRIRQYLLRQWLLGRPVESLADSADLPVEEIRRAIDRAARDALGLIPYDNE